MLSDLLTHPLYFSLMPNDDDDSPAAVGSRLRAVRDVLELSKREFGAKAGLSEQVYGAYENGKRNLSLESAKKIRKAYSLSLEFMYFGNMDDLPTRLSTALNGSPSVKSTQKSSGIPD